MSQRYHIRKDGSGFWYENEVPQEYKIQPKQLPTFSNPQYPTSMRQASGQAYNNVSRLNPFKLIRFVLIGLVIIILFIFGKTIIEYVMKLFGQSGSLWDLISGNNPNSEQKKGYNKELMKQGVEKAKREKETLKHAPISKYLEYLDVSKVKKDARDIIDDLFTAFNGPNLMFYVDTDWVNKLNKLASMNKDEFRLIVRYWDAHYYSEGTLFDFVGSQGQLNTGWGESKAQPFLDKLKSFGLDKKCPKLKK